MTDDASNGGKLGNIFKPSLEIKVAVKEFLVGMVEESKRTRESKSRLVIMLRIKDFEGGGDLST